MSNQIRNAVSLLQDILEAWASTTEGVPPIEALSKAVDDASWELVESGFLPVTMPCGCCALAGFKLVENSEDENRRFYYIDAITRPETAQCH